MNKSIEFMKKRISESSETTYNMPSEGWDEACVFNPIDHFKMIFSEDNVFQDMNNEFSFDIEMEITDEDKKGRVNVTIKYDTDCEFEYFTNVSSTHDGTFVFINENIHKLLGKLMFVNTVNKHKLTEEIERDIFNYSIKYTIGDIVMHSSFGNKEINGHRMAGQTDIMCLPIKFELIKNI